MSEDGQVKKYSSSKKKYDLRLTEGDVALIQKHLGAYGDPRDLRLLKKIRKQTGLVVE